MSGDDKCISCFSGELERRDTNLLCRNCLLVFAPSVGHINYSTEYTENESLYASHFKVLDSFQTTNDIDSVLLPFEKRIIQLLKEKRAKSLVDLGCGIGRFLRASEIVTGNSVGFEVVSQLCERLQSHGRKTVCGGVEDFLKSEIKPEAISMLEVVEHLPNPGELINRIYEEKAPKLLLVVVPDSNTRRRFDLTFKEHDVPPNHLSWWGPKALTDLLRHNNYNVSVELSRESRRSLTHLIRREGNLTRVGLLNWVKAFMNPPSFWLLGMAERK